MRTRLLRPGFFENEDLARLPERARLLFAGLWLVADRAGRLEDRPGRIKAAIFPYEVVDVDPLLDALDGAGFITRYARDGCRCIQVVKFLTHQTPHRREPPSEIPSPDISAKTFRKTQSPGITGLSPVISGPSPVISGHGPGDLDPVRDPVPVCDPVQVQDQDQPAAPEFSDAVEREDPKFKTYAAIYSAVLQDFANDRKHDDPGACDEAFKARCAKQDLAYDADITRKAGDAARHARDKKAAQLLALFATRVRSMP